MRGQSTAAVRRKLLHVFPTFATGGAQARFSDVVNHFGDRWRHVVVAMDGVFECRERLDPKLDLEFLHPTLPKRQTLRNILTCRALLRSIAPDTLVTSNWGALEWALSNNPHNVRHVHMEDGLSHDEAEKQYARRIWLRRVALRRSTVVLPSRSLERLAREVWKLPQSNLRFVPNAVNLQRFASPPRGQADQPIIGTVAALRKEKNLTRLIHAFKVVRDQVDVSLVIVGDGEEREKLESLTSDLGLSSSVRFEGHQARPEDLYRSFNMFALTSDTEQMPLSVLEAMAAGLPIVATNVGDIFDMVSEANQRFIVEKSPQAIAAALLELAASPSLRNSLGEANRRRARAEFDPIIMFDKWAELYDGV